MTDPVEAVPGRAQGEWLVTERRRMEHCEHSWLMALAEYDDSGAWEAEGYYTCCQWLTYKAGMARSTAYEKIRVAHELKRRPVINDAYAEGRISYSAVRLITSLDSADPETDLALTTLAEYGHISDLERAVRIYQRTEDQELGRGLEREERRGVRVRKGLDGLGQLCATLTNAELDQVERLLKMFTDPCAEEGEQSAPADSSPGPAGCDAEPSATADSSPGKVTSLEERLAGVVRAFGSAPQPGPSATADPSTAPASPSGCDAGPSATADSSTPSDEPAGAPVDDTALERLEWRYAYARRRADALMDAVAAALAVGRDGRAVGADRYMVHVVTDATRLLEGKPGRAEIVDGSPLAPEELARICCDCSVVGHLVKDGGEPLALGRKMREWSAAQRRAIAVRDGGTCRFPGCRRHLNDVHHVQPWEKGGPTDVANGALMCRRHHGLVHTGWRAEGNANATLIFFDPFGWEVGRTRPAGALPLVAA